MASIPRVGTFLERYVFRNIGGKDARRGKIDGSMLATKRYLTNHDIFRLQVQKCLTGSETYFTCEKFHHGQKFQSPRDLKRRIAGECIAIPESSWNFLRIVTMEQHFRHTLAETRLSEETRKLQAKWKRFEETSVEPKYFKIASILFDDVGRLIAGRGRCLKYRDTRMRLMSARINFRVCWDLSVFYVSHSLLFQQRGKKNLRGSLML